MASDEILDVLCAKLDVNYNAFYDLNLNFQSQNDSQRTENKENFIFKRKTFI